MLWWEFAKFFMSFLKAQAIFLQILHQNSVPPNITSLHFFCLNINYFCRKERIKVKIFEIFECSSQNSSNYSWTDKSIPLQILLHSSLSWHHTFSTLDKRTPSKSQFRDFLVLLWKLAKLFLSIFGSTSQFSSKLCINLEYIFYVV